MLLNIENGSYPMRYYIVFRNQLEIGESPLSCFSDK